MCVHYIFINHGALRCWFRRTFADVYVLGLQAAVFLIAKFRRSLETDGLKVDDKDAISLMMKEVMLANGYDGIWIFDAIVTSLRKHQEVCSDRRMLRIPPTLLDGSFVSKLRNGGAFWSLRRLSFLSRLNKIINAALDAVIQRKLVNAKLILLQDVPWSSLTLL